MPHTSCPMPIPSAVHFHAYTSTFACERNCVVHVSTLTDDFYVFDAVHRRLSARRSRKRFSVGDKLNVFVARVDRFKRQIDFALADQPKRAADSGTARPVQSKQRARGQNQDRRSGRARGRRP